MTTSASSFMQRLPTIACYGQKLHMGDRTLQQTDRALPA
jgi:hypothetical protein